MVKLSLISISVIRITIYLFSLSITCNNMTYPNFYPQILSVHHIRAILKLFAYIRHTWGTFRFQIFFPLPRYWFISSGLGSKNVYFIKLMILIKVVYGPYCEKNDISIANLFEQRS